MIRIIAPKGKKLRHIPTDHLYSEAVCDEKRKDEYVLAESGADPEVEYMDGVTLSDRVSDLEDAVIELAEIITEG